MASSKRHRLHGHPTPHEARHPGFTLIEILVVIGIIGILSSVVIVAINPNKQFCEAQNAQRKVHEREVRNALQQYLIDKWSAAGGSNLPTTAAQAKPICRSGVTTDATCVNLDALAPTYVVALPVDLSETNAHYTGYKLYKNDAGQEVPVATYYTPTCTATGSSGSSSSAVSSAASSAPFILTKGFDFGSGPVQAGYTQVLSTSLYTSGAGYGLTASALNVDRGTSNSLLRDFIYGLDLGFLADLPNATYQVTTILGDPSAIHDLMQVTAEGTLMATVSANPPGEYAVSTTFNTTVSDGQLNLSFHDAGGSDPNVTLEGVIIRSPDSVGTITISGPAGTPEADGMTVDTYTGTTTGLPDGSLITITNTLGTITTADLSAAVSPYVGLQVQVTNNQFTFQMRRPSGTGVNPVVLTATEVTGLAKGTYTQPYAIAATRRYDFDAGTLVTEPGFLSVRSTATYSLNTGFGWSSGMLENDIPSEPNALRRDMHYFTSGTYSIQVKPNVPYNIRVYMGDPAHIHDNMSVSAEGALQYTVTVPANTTDIHTFSATSTDGIMTISFLDNGGSDPNFVVNAIDISEGPLPPAH